MPPQRTLPSVKPLKTERTHEENQERAYIAASRRSDRSLEARVESARRASKIHKRRTGRSLRVTEQDVINEEMYEEEDDGVLSQYRRCAQTISPYLIPILNAYFTKHMNTLSNATHSEFSQHAPNAPQFAHILSTFPASLVTSALPQEMELVQLPPVGSSHNSHAYRSAPYHKSGRQGFRDQQQQELQQDQLNIRELPPSKVQTLASDPSTPGTESPVLSRRMSMPTVKTGRPDLQIATSGEPSPPSDGPRPMGVRNETDYFTKVPTVSSSNADDFSFIKNTVLLPTNDLISAFMQGDENWQLDGDTLNISKPEEKLEAYSNFYLDTLSPDLGVPVITEGVDPNLLSAYNIDFDQFPDFGDSNSSNAPFNAGTPLATPRQGCADFGWVDEISSA